MEIHQGEWVLVNLAPFIGARRRCRESIPCRILAVDATHVVVGTEHPFRELSLCVASAWIEGKLESDGGRARLRSPIAPTVRQAEMSAVG